MSGEHSQDADTVLSEDGPGADGVHTHVITKLDRFVVNMTDQVLRFRWLVLLLTLGLVFGMTRGAEYITFSSDYRAFFDASNPQLQAFEEIQAVYSKDDNVMFVLKPDSGDAFRADVVAAAGMLTTEGWKLPFATRVDSITNYQHTEANGDDLTVADLIPDPENADEATRQKAKAVSTAEPSLVKRLVSPDGQTMAVNVTMTMPGKAGDETLTAITAAHELADRVRSEYPNMRIGVTGMIPMNAAFVQSSMHDMQTLVPAMIGLLVLTMFFLLWKVSGRLSRRVFLLALSGTFATILLVIFSAVASLGSAGWLGIPLSPPVSNAPVIILTIAIADAIHILISASMAMRHGMTKRAAIIESMRINFQPVFLTSLTTAIGFLALNFAEVPPFQALGNICAIGVTLAWLFSITFLPALISILPFRQDPGEAKEENSRAMSVLGNFVIARRWHLMGGMGLLVVVMTILAPQMSLNDEFVKYFDKGLQFRDDTDFMQENLTGLYQIQFSLSAGTESSAINEPAYLKNLQAFTEWLKEQPEVAHVQSFVDVMTRLNKNMHGDDPSWYRIPEERELAAQYLLLYEFSLPYGLDLNNQINVDKTSTRMIVTLHNVATRETRDIEARATAWVAENFPQAAGAHATGPTVMFAHISERSINSMLSGTALAFVMISVVLILALRSLKLGLISLIPNLVPAIIAFGIWYIFVGQVGMEGSIVTATSLGIIVDATVHFLSKYLRARRERGDSPEDAIRYAFSTVGTALWVTTAILVVGFSVLAQSMFSVNQVMGLLTALAILAALVTDFLLLPPLLLLIDRKSSRDSKAASPSQGSDAQPQQA